MEERKSNYQSLLYFLLYAGFLLIALRYAVAFRFLFLPLMGIALLGVGIYATWTYFQRKQREKRFRNSVEGMIQTRMDECNAQIKINSRDITEIEENIAELRQRLNLGSELPPRLRAETEELIQNFQAQLQLRASKVAFFQTCKSKLQQLLHQHELVKALESKKEKLRQMQENNLQDIAVMEELKTNVEYDILYLDSIENLSRRLQASTNYNDAERLREELDKMTKSLDKF
ncbi:MAG: hypothetical protein ACK4TA_08080 [Saprospiraceae bacterium]